MARKRYGKELEIHLCVCGKRKDHRAKYCMDCRYTYNPPQHITVVRKAGMTSQEKAIRKKFRKYCYNAQSRGYKFELDIDQFSSMVTKPCHYCGDNSKLINGIDRVDNTLGYVKGNMVTCCKICNYAKMNIGYKDFFNWVERVYYHNLQKSPKTLNLSEPQSHKTVYIWSELSQEPENKNA